MNNKEKVEITTVIIITMFISPDIIDVKRPEKYMLRIYNRCSKVLQKHNRYNRKELLEVIETANSFYLRALETYKEDNLIIHTGLITYVLSHLTDLSNPPYNLPNKIFTKMLHKHNLPPTITQISQATELALYFRELTSEHYNVEKKLIYKELQS